MAYGCAIVTAYPLMDRFAGGIRPTRLDFTMHGGPIPPHFQMHSPEPILLFENWRTIQDMRPTLDIPGNAKTPSSAGSATGSTATSADISALTAMNSRVLSRTQAMFATFAKSTEDAKLARMFEKLATSWKDLN